MKKHLLAIAVTALAAGSAFAQAGDTLAKIKSSGSVTLGVRESSGLGYTLGNGKYVGFHTEMGERVLADIQKELGLAKLDIKYQPVTSQPIPSPVMLNVRSVASTPSGVTASWST
jgi:glutamate/aspartate transport system substrate-binding protein